MRNSWRSILTVYLDIFMTTKKNLPHKMELSLEIQMSIKTLKTENVKYKTKMLR